MIHDVIYSLLVLIEKLAFFNKQLQGFIISLINAQEIHFFEFCVEQVVNFLCVIIDLSLKFYVMRLLM